MLKTISYYILMYHVSFILINQLQICINRDFKNVVILQTKPQEGETVQYDPTAPKKSISKLALGSDTFSDLTGGSNSLNGGEFAPGGHNNLLLMHVL